MESLAQAGSVVIPRWPSIWESLEISARRHADHSSCEPVAFCTLQSENHGECVNMYTGSFRCRAGLEIPIPDEVESCLRLVVTGRDCSSRPYA